MPTTKIKKIPIYSVPILSIEKNSTDKNDISFEDFQKLSTKEKAKILSNSMDPNRPEITMEEIVAECKIVRTEMYERKL
jgi:hypothetical protein